MKLIRRDPWGELLIGPFHAEAVAVGIYVAIFAAMEVGIVVMLCMA